jgi:hypothetical protein
LWKQGTHDQLPNGEGSSRREQEGEQPSREVRCLFEWRKQVEVCGGASREGFGGATTPWVVVGQRRRGAAAEWTTGALAVVEVAEWS